MLEIIVETVADAIAAQKGGATQLDLKADFLEDGITPSVGMVERICGEVSIPVIVMIRPYADGMVLSSDDVAVMCTDINRLRRLGMAGFLLGAVTNDRSIDQSAVSAFQEAARGLPLHFHLAWEMTPDHSKALEDLVSLGVRSARTTGGQGRGGKAVNAVAQIAAFREQAGDRLDLLLAGGVSSGNIAHLVSATGLGNAHAGSSVRNPPNQKGAVDFRKVRELRSSLDEAVAALGTHRR